MSDYPIFIYAAVLILGFGIFSKLAERSVVTPPMVFVLFGFIASLFRVDFAMEGLYAPVMEIIAELTLILVLFIDASTINLKELLRDRQLPVRLLFIGLPITMLIGIILAYPLFPGMNIWILAIMAIMLSPTDAALGQAVVTSKRVPEKIRQTINVESGLNDGIALPPLLICLAAVSDKGPETSGLVYWGMFILKQFIFGPLVGGLVGYAGGKLIERFSKRNWMNSTFQRLTSISLAILAYSLAEAVHGNGFIAAFFAGLLLGTTTRSIRERIHEYGAAESQILQLLIFLLFGMILIPYSYPMWDWHVWVYALLSLTVIRVVPAVLSLSGTGLTRGTKYFIGWFGPRGIASILYLIMVYLELGTQGMEKVIAVVVLTVLLSIVFHGITANPLSKALQLEK